MKIRDLSIIFILLLGAILCFSVAGTAGELDEGCNDEAAAFLERINAARENPLGTAESLGLSGEKVIQAFPDNETVLREGMAPLAWNQALSDLGRETGEMIFSGEPLENMKSSGSSTDIARLNSLGYRTGAYERLIGIVAFNNFITPQKAADVIFRDLLTSEFDPVRKAMSTVLSQGFEDAGIYMGQGLLPLGGSFVNAFIMVAVLANPLQLDENENTVVYLMNQFRSSPVTVAQAWGREPGNLFDPQGVFSGEGLPALRIDPVLCAIAREKALQLSAAGEIVSGDSCGSSSIVPEDENSGVDTTGGEGVLGNVVDERFMTFDLPAKQDAGETINAIFGKILEFEALQERKLLTDDTITDVGISMLRTTKPYSGGYSIWESNVVAVAFGRSAGGVNPVVTGLVFQDRNADGVYQAGEGVPDITLTFDDAAGQQVMTTDSAGGFILSMEPGVGTLSLSRLRGDETRLLSTEGENQFVSFRFNYPVVEFEEDAQ